MELSFQMTRILTILLSGISSWASPPDAAEPPAPTATSSSDSTSYESVVADLEAEMALLIEDPTAGNGPLANALLALVDHAPSLAKDPDTLARRVDAMLQLARLQLANSPTIAAQTMDEAIRQAHGVPLPAASYGPRLDKLYQERLEVMNNRGTAELEVNCTIRCRVYIDGHEKPIVSGPLHLGPHNVWVEDARGVHPPMRSIEDLSVAGKTYQLSYGPHVPRQRTSAPVASLAPRWAEITLITLGAGMLIGGTTAFAVYGASQETFDARPLALALTIGLGGVGLGVGSVMLSVDRQRNARNESRQVMLSWRAQF
jgi:hypothetical protein